MPFLWRPAGGRPPPQKKSFTIKPKMMQRKLLFIKNLKNRQDTQNQSRCLPLSLVPDQTLRSRSDPQNQIRPSEPDQTLRTRSDPQIQIRPSEPDQTLRSRSRSDPQIQVRPSDPDPRIQVRPSDPGPTLRSRSDTLRCYGPSALMYISKDIEVTVILYLLIVVLLFRS